MEFSKYTVYIAWVIIIFPVVEIPGNEWRMRQLTDSTNQPQGDQNCSTLGGSQKPAKLYTCVNMTGYYYSTAKQLKNEQWL